MLEQNARNIRTYRKLVRDNTPEIIEKLGNIPAYGIVRGLEYQQALKAKICEEAAEVAKAATAERLCGELADVLEVVYALANAAGISLETLLIERIQRRQERGGFRRGVFLETVEELNSKYNPDEH